ncbi:hypothetical protein E0H73_21320 [Kribbella pittospori]|uniref:Zinc finger CGNR domain-containing protein n=1 Tax=Kribbella pittospori TaxID=722689 RepID=A0A4R0KMH4_9ACTN|nr:ABATE domain-containing protein [Kribbella pittospori]TCC60474.1 hypothetical protein E0H73_21320 [Kribbella pittospori]
MSTLAFALAATIRHDGNGGVADLLATPADAGAWVEQQHDQIATVLDRHLEITDPGELRGELVRIRGAVRALFARAVAPEPPSKADSDRLMDAEAALRMVNRAADRLGTAHLDWPVDGPPAARWSGRTGNETALLVGAIGRSAIDFLAGPDRDRLRACPAARCVKYFLQDDPRQTWCSPACGNRERVNRHYRRQHGR